MLQLPKQNMYMLGLAVVVLALQITGLSTNEWSKKDNVKWDKSGVMGTVEMGLWKGCVKSKVQGASVKKCDDIPSKDSPHSLQVCRAFSILGAIFVLMAGVLMCCGAKWAKYQNWVLLLGGLCSIVAVGVWAGELNKQDGVKMDLGYSWILSLVAGVLAVLGSGFPMVQKWLK